VGAVGDGGGWVDDANGPTSEADLERLAARVAMLASEDGEADNAGRAIGLLARRIGLSGGDLKRIFLAGASTTMGPGRTPGQLLDDMEHEVETLRQSVRLLDADARRAAAERDSLLGEVGVLQTRLRHARTAARGWGVAGGVALSVLVFAGALQIFGGPAPPRRADPAPAGAALPGMRTASIRAGGAVMFREPDRAGAPLANLSGGTRVQVRRLVWKALVQWAEVDLPGGRTGYVLTTEIELS
jgi:hypothetical protein